MQKILTARSKQLLRSKAKSSLGEKRAADSEETAYKRAQESQKAHRRSATEESTKGSDALRQVQDSIWQDI
jgi:hypothetical protein